MIFASMVSYTQRVVGCRICIMKRNTWWSWWKHTKSHTRQKTSKEKPHMCLDHSWAVRGPFLGLSRASTVRLKFPVFPLQYRSISSVWSSFLHLLLLLDWSGFFYTSQKHQIWHCGILKNEWYKRMLQDIAYTSCWIVLDIHGHSCTWNQACNATKNAQSFCRRIKTHYFLVDMFLTRAKGPWIDKYNLTFCIQYSAIPKKRSQKITSTSATNQ